MTLHAAIGAGNIHVPYQWVYSDAAARAAASGFSAGDVGKLARQLDDNSFWVLSDDSPATWVAVGGTGSAYVPGGTDVPVADGGTGASTASGARTNLGLVIGTDVAAQPPVNDARYYTETEVDALFASAGSYTDEMARDALGAALTAGTGITVTPNDPANTITIASTITQYTDEQVRDVIGAALVAGANVTVTVNDGADTITLAATGYTDEQVRDVIGAALVAGSNVTITVDDAGDTITIAAAAGSALRQLVPGWKTGQWYGSDIWAYGTAVSDMFPANTTWGGVPVYVPTSGSVDRIGIYVPTAVAGASFRLGIYAALTNGWVGDLVLDGGTVSAATTGEKTVTVSQALTGGTWYYIVFHPFGAANVWCKAHTNFQRGGLGATAVLNLGSPFPELVGTGLAANAYSAAFPTTLGGTVATNNFLPILGLRAA